MHLKPARTATAVAAVGGVLVLGLGAAQAAKANPEDFVRCNANALGDAINDGGTLYLTPDCIYHVPGTLTVDTDTTIFGDGATLVGGGSRSDYSILYVDCMEDLTLNGVNLTEGSADEGGAIDNDGDLTINGGLFSHNSAGGGGAIYSTGKGASLTINNAVFTGNEGEDGGAIWSETDNPVLTGVHFGQNRAADGGALYFQNDATVQDSSFLGNVASDEGGAIWNDGGLVLQNITDVAGSGNEFEGNEAYLGGGIYNTDWVGVGESLIMSNAAHHGGGIYDACTETVVLTDSTIIENVTDNIYYADC